MLAIARVDDVLDASARAQPKGLAEVDNVVSVAVVFDMRHRVSEAPETRGFGLKLASSTVDVG
nr:hypothetical protein [Actinomycetota bacterium]